MGEGSGKTATRQSDPARDERRAENRQGQRDTERSLRQIELLLGAFGDEMQKLNETLQVLAAHLERLRASIPRDGDTLH
jgi:hypothetical protein